MAIAADEALKSGEAPKTKAGGWFEMALAIHFAAGRFASPAGMVFIQHNYVPLRLGRKR